VQVVAADIILTVLLARAVVWRFLYQLQSRLQTTEPLVAVAVGVGAARRIRISIHSSTISFTSAVAVGVEAEQEPLTLQVELAAIQVALTGTLAHLAELAQAGVLA
jgi:hypothetical protein